MLSALILSLHVPYELFFQHEKESILEEWLPLISISFSNCKCISLALKIKTWAPPPNTYPEQQNRVVSRHGAGSALPSWSGYVLSLQSSWRGMMTYSEFRHFSPSVWPLGFPGPCLVRAWLHCCLSNCLPTAHGRPVRRQGSIWMALMELIYQINNYVLDL